MRFTRFVISFLLLSISVPALAQQAMMKGDKNWMALEKELWDVEQQWLTTGPYFKPNAQDAIDFRLKFKADQFFAIDQTGKIQTKAEQAASQSPGTKTRPTVPPGQGANPQDFKLMAVYGNVAMATDHSTYKSVDSSGKLATTMEARVLRIFVKENGKWKPGAMVQVPIAKP